MSDSLPTPRHVAIIMDGNGRWAKSRGLPRIKGHEEGAKSVRAIIKACSKHGIEVVTLYAFSRENWVRPKEEVSGLMALLPRFLRSHSSDLHENNIRLRAIGRLDDLPPKTRSALDQVMSDTAHYTNHQVVLALSYGGRTELADACRKIAGKAVQGNLDPNAINEQTVNEHLYAPDLPPPDLMIRTSGEHRLSNFLPWQLAYAEFYFTPEFWPDFREDSFARAIDAYCHRHRRFGDVT